jgi:hypothetical protein
MAAAQRGYAKSWCTGSGSGLLLGQLIAEADALDELAEAVGTV